MCSGISLLPYSDHVYQQAPYEEIDEEKYNEAIAESVLRKGMRIVALNDLHIKKEGKFPVDYDKSHPGFFNLGIPIDQIYEDIFKKKIKYDLSNTHEKYFYEKYRILL